MHKLDKTLLSGKITRESKALGILSFLLLVVLFGLDPHLLQANGMQVFAEGQYWRAFSSIFVHADYQHLAHNAVSFTFLAVLLHNFFGNLIYPLVSLLSGGIINLIVLPFYDPRIYLVGISGVVYFMAAFWLVMYLYVERTISFRKRAIIATGLFLIFLAPEAIIKEEVSYLSHAVGFLLGIPAGVAYYFWKKEEIRSYDQWIWKKVVPDWTVDEDNFLIVPEQDTRASCDTPSQSS